MILDAIKGSASSIHFQKRMSALLKIHPDLSPMLQEEGLIKAYRVRLVIDVHIDLCFPGIIQSIFSLLEKDMLPEAHWPLKVTRH